MTAASGITFRHDDGGSGEKYLVESVSAGLALFDFDGDGLIDIYFVNGAPLPPRKADPTITNALYRNEGDFHFRDVTREAGVGDAGFGLGVAVGDYDNDGDPDIYVNNFGPNVLYRNNGDGTFDSVTDRAGVACGNRVGAGTCFLDANGDGRLDLYVANYVDIQIKNHVRRMMNGVPQLSRAIVLRTGRRHALLQQRRRHVHGCQPRERRRPGGGQRNGDGLR